MHILNAHQKPTFELKKLLFQKRIQVQANKTSGLCTTNAMSVRVCGAKLAAWSVRFSSIAVAHKSFRSYRDSDMKDDSQCPVC